MERRSAIAVTAAAAGVLIAGTVAGLAVANAATSSTLPERPRLSLADAYPMGTAVESLDMGAGALEPLPAIVVPMVEQTAPAPALTQRQAAALVAAATGGNVLAASPTTHNGYDAYAVQVERADGSIVTGLVEATSGVIYDWTLDREAPPAPKPAYEGDEYEDDEYEEYEGHDDEKGSEYGDEHEGDDDDD